MNNIVIDGRLTRDPESSVTAKGVEVVEFTVANDRKKSKDEKQSSFFRCQAFGKTGAFVSQYFKKGDPIILSGECEVRSYEDKEGKKRTAVTVYADKVSFTIGKGKNAEQVSSEQVADVPTEDLPF